VALEGFVTLALEIELSPRENQKPQGALQEALSDLIEGLKAGGCTLIGHIKGRVSAGDGQPLFFSITTLDNNLSFKGGPLVGDDTLSLAVNVIVTGIEKDEVAELLEDSFKRYFYLLRP
jgi:hypothetical protein